MENNSHMSNYKAEKYLPIKQAMKPNNLLQIREMKHFKLHGLINVVRGDPSSC